MEAKIEISSLLHVVSLIRGKNVVEAARESDVPNPPLVFHQRADFGIVGGLTVRAALADPESKKSPRAHYWVATGFFQSFPRSWSASDPSAAIPAASAPMRLEKTSPSAGYAAAILS